MEYDGVNFRGVGEGEAYFSVDWSDAAAAFLRKHRCPRVTFSGAWGDFGFISDYADFIEDLNFHNEDRSVAGVSTLHNLKRLMIEWKPKTPVDFSGLRKLEHCIVSWDKSYADTLFSLPRLKYLRIMSFADPDFRHVAPNASLEKLGLRRPRIETLEGIAAFPRLRELELADCSGLSSFAGIEPLEKLKCIRIINARKLTHIPSLARLKELELLILGNVDLPDLQFAYELKRLASLSVGGEPVSVDWPRLLRLSHLTDIKLLVGKDGCPTEDELRAMLTESGRTVESLELYSTRKSNWVSVGIKCTPPV